MKTVVLLYNTSCIYEIVILNYFLKYTGKEIVFVSCDGNSIIATEGYSINVFGQLWDINHEDVELLIVPGGDITEIDNCRVWDYLAGVQANQGLIAVSYTHLSMSIMIISPIYSRTQIGPAVLNMPRSWELEQMTMN